MPTELNDVSLIDAHWTVELPCVPGIYLRRLLVKRTEGHRRKYECVEVCMSDGQFVVRGTQLDPWRLDSLPEPYAWYGPIAPAPPELDLEHERVVLRRKREKLWEELIATERKLEELQ